MENCLFCKIVSGEIPSKKEYESENILVFHDITPQAPFHVLVIPKVHISNMNEIGDLDPEILKEIFHIIPKVAKQNGIAEKGYRLVNNCGNFGGQTVHHIHFHLLGGRHMNWPPG
ncbi:histidine triad nucleotide-binding protein [Leptospira congkakensis]|uniref:Histidine triad nucleotide-binding protein n=1 Tax=Leptospira congkakensis TaxID=2484932 RepID=A0A4Z1AMI2_9LEPT|nr:histidine triad nucleotide-binding protein [Leptospira congkakensis]TGL90730.1 histidine triad nucleotide-binding protein [Leptospira congkakensis]TGL91737.1 histidine triad nucleotide-binding protein [Leptospira congkakensis]TGL98791.1 histidine triad nucleotide-binding protein [Leptospira congkakensis]